MNAWLTLTYNCNLGCRWCYAADAKHGDFMSLEMVKVVLKIFKDLGVRRIVLIGGEPSIHPDFLEIVSLCKESGFKIELTTNGLMFADEKFLDEAVKRGLSMVQISLKALSQKDFIAHTGQDGFYQQIKAIINFSSRKKNCTSMVNIILTKYFMDNFFEALNQIKLAGIELFTLDLPRPIYNGFGTRDDFSADIKETVAWLIKMMGILPRMNLSYVLRLALPFCRFPRELQPLLAEKLNVISNCFMKSTSTIVVNPLGEVIPCNSYPQKILGKIGVDFSSAAEYDRFRQRPDVLAVYKELLHHPFLDNCAICRWREKCCGGCPLFFAHYGKEVFSPMFSLTEAMS